MITERFRIDFHYLSLAYYASDWLIHLDICMSIRSIMGVNPGGMGRVHPVFGVEGGEYLITPPPLPSHFLTCLMKFCFLVI
jgi:hypothetical protein